jgi:polar amino acid transport system permease protein
MTGTRCAWDFSLLWRYCGPILTGLGVTIAHTIGKILLGLVVGLVAGLLRLSGAKIVPGKGERA